jgi:hypothetical protein
LKRIPLILVLALLLIAAAHAQEAKCPGFQGKSPLTGVSVFDGPPADKADLVPDVSRGTHELQYASWDIGYLSGSTHGVYLVCRYAGSASAEPVTLKIDKKAQTCTFRAHAAGQPAEASCK